MSDDDTIVVNIKPQEQQMARTKKSGDNDKKASKSKKRKFDAVVIHQKDTDSKQTYTENGDLTSGSVDRPSKKSRGNRDVENEKSEELDTSKPSALFKPVKGRDWTLSIALPGSFIANVAKPDHKTLLAGRIARAAAVFCVDEIVIFDDDPENIPNYISDKYRGRDKTKQEVLDSILQEDELWQNPDQFLLHILSYAECPPHLRYDIEDPKLSLFPQHNNLKWAGQLPSLDMPHHMKAHEWCRYREGVTLGPPQRAQTKKSKEKSRKLKETVEDNESWTYVKCGLPYPVKVPTHIDPMTRVTLKFSNPDPPPSWPRLSQAECEHLEVEAVPPETPREEEGYYWGFTVRRANCISDVITECNYVVGSPTDGYDVTIGTSERGDPLASILPDSISPPSRTRHKAAKKLPDKCKHLLMVFGGVAGLEPAIASDPEFKALKLTKETAHEAFDIWVNLVPGQGSRTIRTEEAVEFGLFGIKEYMDSQYDHEKKRSRTSK